MDDSTNLTETLKSSFLDLVDSAVDFLPNLLVATVLIIIGIILAGIISKFIGRVVDYLENSKPVVKSLKEVGIKKIDIDGVVTIFVKWAIILIFLGAAVDVLGLTALTETFDALVAFTPNIFAAAIIASLAFVASNALRDIVDESAKAAKIAVHKFLGNLTRVIVLIFGLPFAAAQLGLDLTIINNNITVVLAGVMLAFGLAFGLGGREVAGKIVGDLYKNWRK